MSRTCRWRSGCESGQLPQDVERIGRVPALPQGPGRFAKRVLMLDVHVIRANLDAVKANCRNRNVPAADPDLVVRLDDERKRLVQEAQTVQQKANELSKGIGKEKDEAKKESLKAEGKRLREQVAAAEKQAK